MILGIIDNVCLKVATKPLDGCVTHGVQHRKPNLFTLRLYNVSNLENVKIRAIILNDQKQEIVNAARNTEQAVIKENNTNYSTAEFGKLAIDVAKAYYIQFLAIQQGFGSNFHVLAEVTCPIHVVTNCGEQQRKWVGSQLFNEMCAGRREITRDEIKKILQTRCAGVLRGILQPDEMEFLLALAGEVGDKFTKNDFYKCWNYYFEAERSLYLSGLEKFFSGTEDAPKIIWFCSSEATQSLLGHRVGESLLRFSKSNPASMAIDYVAEIINGSPQIRRAVIVRDDLQKMKNLAEEIRDRPQLLYIFQLENNQTPIMTHKKILLQHLCPAGWVDTAPLDPVDASYERWKVAPGAPIPGERSKKRARNEN